MWLLESDKVGERSEGSQGISDLGKEEEHFSAEGGDCCGPRQVEVLGTN